MSKAKAFFKGQEIIWDQVEVRPEAMTMEEFRQKYMISRRTFGHSVILETRAAVTEECSNWQETCDPSFLFNQEKCSLESMFYKLRGLADRAIDDIRRVK